MPRADENGQIHRFVPPHTRDELYSSQTPLEEYAPDNLLIHSVRIYPWKSTYHYYEDFVRDATRLYPIHGEPCPHVSFFSYVPQYSQLNREQLEWYLWWRESVRKGEYPATDYSYLQLYLFELINLSEKTDPYVTAKALCDLWIQYRGTYCQLDGFLPEWLCDFALLHRVDLTGVIPMNMIPAAMEHCVLKECLVAPGRENGYAKVLLAFCSNYNYRKSKFYTGSNREFFDRWIAAVLEEVVSKTKDAQELLEKAKRDDSRLMRDAYTGALCSYRIKRKIEVIYCSFFRSHELRYLISDIVKYTENQLRSRIGVRSRLSIYALPAGIRSCIDSYLGKNLPPKKPSADAARKAEVAVYEKQYDLPQKPFSLADAAKIEAESWNTTEKLVEAFGDPETAETPVLPAAEEPKPAVLPKKQEDASPLAGFFEDANEALLLLLAPYRAFLRGVYDENRHAQIFASKKIGRMADVLADEINGIAADVMGDILLEDADNGGYRILDDYLNLDLWERLFAGPAADSDV